MNSRNIEKVIKEKMNKKLENKKLSNYKGITLVSLVVIIIVLIILAGISINLTLGENGIFRIAMKSKENMELAQIEEKERLNELYVQLDLSDNREDLDTNENSSQTEESSMMISLDISLGKSIILGVGATIESEENRSLIWQSSSEEVASIIAGNNGTATVQGLQKGTTIITANTTDGSNKKAICQVRVKEITVKELAKPQQTFDKNITVKDEYGNLVVIPAGFHIVPHGQDNVEYNYSGNHIPSVQDGIVIEDEKGNQFVWIPVGTIKDKTGHTTEIKLGRYTFDSNGTPTLQRDANKDVSTSYGYYIARYEASKGEDGKVQSKTYSVWNYINQPNAVTNSKQMYTNVEYKSDLMDCYAWDTAIVFIEKYSEGNSNYANQHSKNSALGNTGERSGTTDKVCNIYDMASNCYEWATDESRCVVRGDDYIDRCYSPSFCIDYPSSATAVGITFRVTIYISN